MDASGGELGSVALCFARWRMVTGRTREELALARYADELEKLRAKVQVVLEQSKDEVAALEEENASLHGEVRALRAAVVKKEMKKDEDMIRGQKAIEELAKLRRKLQAESIARDVHRRAKAEEFARVCQRRYLQRAFSAWMRVSRGRTTLGRAGRWASRLMHRQLLAGVFTKWRLEVSESKRWKAQDLLQESTIALAAAMEREKRATGIQARAVALMTGREDAFLLKQAFGILKHAAERTRHRSKALVSRWHHSTRRRVLTRAFSALVFATGRSRFHRTAPLRRKLEDEVDRLRGALRGARERYKEAESVLEKEEDAWELRQRQWSERVARPLAERLAHEEERTRLARKIAMRFAILRWREMSLYRKQRQWIQVLLAHAAKKKALLRSWRRWRQRLHQDGEEKRVLLSAALLRAQNTTTSAIAERDSAVELMRARELHFEAVDSRRRRQESVLREDALRCRARLEVARRWSRWRRFVELKRREAVKKAEAVRMAAKRTHTRAQAMQTKVASVFAQRTERTKSSLIFRAWKELVAKNRAAHLRSEASHARHIARDAVSARASAEATAARVAQELARASWTAEKSWREREILRKRIKELESLAAERDKGALEAAVAELEASTKRRKHERDLRTQQLQASPVPKPAPDEGEGEEVGGGE